jgi:hypothetical protein
MGKTDEIGKFSSRWIHRYSVGSAHYEGGSNRSAGAW